MRAKAALYAKNVWAKLKDVALPIQVGFVATVLWMVFLAIYLSRGTRWVDLWALQLNNMGDFLAGAFAPLAFLWLVIAVLLQTTELGLQRKELAQSTAETHALVEQNKLSVDVATKALAQQQLRAREDRLHQVIDALAFKIISLADHSSVSVGGNRSEPFGNQRYLREQAEAGGGRDAVFPAALNRIVSWLFYVSEAQQRTPPSTLVPSPTLVEEVQLLLDEFQRIAAVLEKEPELETVRARAYALDLVAYVDALQDILSVLNSNRQPALQS